MATYKLKDFAKDISVAIKDAQSSPLKRFVGLEHYDSGEPVITRFTDTSLITSSVKEFHENDILIARRNVYLRRAGIAFFSGLTSGDSIILRIYDDCEEKTGIPKEDAIKIIPFILNSNNFWNYANKHADGMNSKRISKEMLYDYEFDLPSLAEQKILADKLWAAYRLKESYKKLLAATDEMVKSQFIEMFENSPKTKLSDFCELKARIGWQGLKHEEFLDKGDYYLVTGVDFDGKSINWSRCHYVTKDRYDQDTNIQLHNGDVLVTKDGTIGKVAIVSGLDGPATLNSGVFVLRDKKGLTLNRFLFYCLLTKDFEKFIEDCKTGSTIAHLNQKAFVNYLIPTPGLALQEKFVTIAEQADKSKFVELKSQFIEMFGTMDNAKYDMLPMVSVCERSGQYGSNTSACDYIPGTPRYIRITDINDDGSLNDDIKSAESIDDKYVLNEGDLVFARTGATVGKTYLHQSGEAIYAGYLIKYHPIENRVNPEYLFAYTHSAPYYAWVELTKKVGAQPNISATQYDELPVIVPPIEKQKEFVKIAQQADKSKFELRKSIEAIDAVIKSLINS